MTQKEPYDVLRPKFSILTVPPKLDVIIAFGDDVRSTNFNHMVALNVQQLL